MHPDDVTLLGKFKVLEQTGRWGATEWHYRLVMPDGSIKYLPRDRSCDPRPGRSTGVHRGGSGRHCAPAVRGSSGEGEIGAFKAIESHQFRRAYGVDRTRSEPAAFGHHHERRNLSADAGCRPSERCGAQTTVRRTIRDGNRAADVVKRLRALFSNEELTLEVLDLNEVTREVIALSVE